MSSSFTRMSATLFGCSTLLMSGFANAQAPDSAPAAASPTPSVEPAQTPASADAPSNANTTPTQGQAPAPQTAVPQVTPTPAPSADANDEPPALFSSRSHWGGYGGLDVAYTRLAGKDAALFCGGGALLADHRFSLGLVGCGNATRISGQSYGDVVHESDDRLEFGYGGLVLGYQFFSRSVYNLALTTMVGAGATAIVNRSDRWNNDYNWRDHDDVKTHDAVFVAEPRLTGYVNLTRWARMGAFAGYRFVGGVQMTNLSSSDLSGPVIGGTLQFGWF
jgi:hypothetical protein